MMDSSSETQPIDVNMRRINMDARQWESNDTLGLFLKAYVHMTGDLHRHTNSFLSCKDTKTLAVMRNYGLKSQDDKLSVTTCPAKVEHQAARIQTHKHKARVFNNISAHTGTTRNQVYLNW